MTDLGVLSLRRSERGFLVGGSGSGKSTLALPLLLDFLTRYPGGRVLVLDSKPRFRADWTMQGTSAARRYRSWDHGPLIRGSVVVDEPGQLRDAWRFGHRCAIAQGESSADIARLTATARVFHGQARSSVPQLVVVDELLDFFHPNGSPRAGTDDTLVRVVRAGRERGEGALYCSQRTRGIPTQIVEELSKLYLFRLDFVGDARRLPEMGAPESITPPAEDHEFVYWTKRERSKVWGPYRLSAAAVQRIERQATRDAPTT